MKEETLTLRHLRNLADIKAKETGIKHTAALNEVAQQNGFRSWPHAVKALAEGGGQEKKGPVESPLLTALKKQLYCPSFASAMFGRWLNPARIEPLPPGWIDILTAFGKAPMNAEVESALVKLSEDSSLSSITKDMALPRRLMMIRDSYQLAWGELNSFRTRGFLIGPREDIHLLYLSNAEQEALWRIAGATTREMEWLEMSRLWGAYRSIVMEMQCLGERRCLKRGERVATRHRLRREAGLAYEKYRTFTEAHCFGQHLEEHLKY